MHRLHRDPLAPAGLRRYQYGRDTWSMQSPTSAERGEIWAKLDAMQGSRCAYCEAEISEGDRHPQICGKLIEVALPLDAINKRPPQSLLRARSPSGMGTRARCTCGGRGGPLAAARAVIFAQLVNDPVLASRAASASKNYRSRPAEDQRVGAGGRARHLWWARRPLASAKRLFAGKIILKSWCCGRTPPTRPCWRAPAPRLPQLARGVRAQQGPPAGGDAVQPRAAARLHDPFAGGGAMPLEAQRLGLEALPATSTRGRAHQQGHDRDPAQVRRAAPVGPVRPAALAERHGEAFRRLERRAGLAEDVRRYGAWMRERGAAAHRPPVPEHRNHS
jgi:putative DNA methylase